MILLSCWLASENEKKRNSGWQRLLIMGHNKVCRCSSGPDIGQQMCFAVEVRLVAFNVIITAVHPIVLSTTLYDHLGPHPSPVALLTHPLLPCISSSPEPRWPREEDTDGCHTTCQIPLHRNIHSPSCEASFQGALITDHIPLNPAGPSTAPEELQLTALNSSSVLVRWRPPLEPNGIIISYSILYSWNLSEPEHLWRNLSQNGRFPGMIYL